MSFDAPRKKAKSVENDDLKQGEDNNGGGNNGGGNNGGGMQGGGGRNNRQK